jgi:hypothetical protein
VLRIVITQGWAGLITPLFFYINVKQSRHGAGCGVPGARLLELPFWQGQQTAYQSTCHFGRFGIPSIEKMGK